MKPSLWLFTACLLWLKGCRCAPTWKDKPAAPGVLKGFSEAGETKGDEEVKKALTGIKQMKIMMERREEEHTHLMETLRRCKGEKQEALKLMNEVQEHLEEEKGLCHVSLTGSWRECKPCMESGCMRSYATCQSNRPSVKSTVGQFFWKIYQFLFPFQEDAEKDSAASDHSMDEDVRLAQMESVFSQLAAEMRLLFNSTCHVFKQLQQGFDQAFQSYFTSGTDLTESYFPPALPKEPTRNVDLVQSWDLSNFFQLFCNFSLSIYQRFSETISATLHAIQDLPKQDTGKYVSPAGSAQEALDPKMSPPWDRSLCEELGQNLPECFQFHTRCRQCQDYLWEACPGVPVLHAKVHETRKLVNVSSQQFAQVLQMAQQHLQDATYLLEKMREQSAWLAELVANQTPRSEDSFTSVKGLSGIHEGDLSSQDDMTRNFSTRLLSLTAVLPLEKKAESHLHELCDNNGCAAS
ncbi:clusterin-like protein 1 [Erinaceus europaeus]|uniref:Clusterin n=1 Tax=Erinaceus europaeus TaxID=9365 RepID=A0ABM3Y6T7_ERIEU|nr:clusterin-like protein 1 [Erinaceus europaeus]